MSMVERKVFKIVKGKEKEEVVDDEIVFRIRRPQNQSSLGELIVNRLPRKKVKVNNEAEEDEERLCQEFMSKASIQHSVQYFLKKVDNPISENDKSIFSHKSAQLATRERSSMREAIFNQARGISPKIMDLEQSQIELGDKRFKVQNLGALHNQYYVLRKRRDIKQGPSVYLPEQADRYLREAIFEEEQQRGEMEEEADDEDSNRESNPDFDYPEEDGSGEGSEDEGVIRDFYDADEDDNGSESEGYELDQEELYRRYQKRCKKEDSDDDGVQYFDY